MGQADYFKPGDFNAACSICGRKRKGSTLVRNWQGLWRCVKHNEPRQPQDFARGIIEHPETPFIQKETDTFVLVCTFNGQAALPDIAVAGCMRAGNGFINPEAL